MSVFLPGFCLAGPDGFAALGARVTLPPNPSLVELAAVVGEENVRLLVRTFLREFPGSLRLIAAGERKDRHRLIHSLKSSARVIGAHPLSERLALLEARLADAAHPDLTPAELDQLAAEFEAVVSPLREFVAP